MLPLVTDFNVSSCETHLLKCGQCIKHLYFYREFFLVNQLTTGSPVNMPLFSVPDIG